MQKPLISVLIACYNEEKTISRVIESHLEVLKDNAFTSNWDIHVLNDGSTDNSNEQIDKWTKIDSRIKLISNLTPSGIFQAQNLLYKSTNADWCYFTSGDGQYPASILKEMLSVVTSDDLIVVSKRINKIQIYNLQRIIISYLYRGFCWILSGLDAIDPGSTKLVSKKLLNQEFYCNYLAKDAEIVVKAKKSNRNVKIINCQFGNRDFGKSSAIKTKVLVKTFVDLLKLIKYRFN